MKKRSIFSNSLFPKSAAPTDKIVNLPVYVFLMLCIIVITMAGILTSFCLIFPEQYSYRFIKGLTLNTLSNWWSGTTEKNWLDWYLFYSAENPLVTNGSIALSGMVLVIITVITGRWLFYKMATDSLLHVRGSVLLEGKSATQALRRFFKAEYAFAGKGLKIHPDLAIPKNRENQNMLILGAVGTGKTQYLLPIIQQVVKSKTKKSIIFDFKSDFTEYFLNHSGVALIAPWDKRSLVWDLKADIKTVQDAQLFAEALIPDSKSSADPMWIMGSRSILAGIVISAIATEPETWGWHTLAKLLSADAETLRKHFLQHYPRAVNLVEKGSKTTSSFLQTLQSYCQPIYNFADLAEDGQLFSIKAWIKDDESVIRHLILQNSTEFVPLAKASVELMLYFATRYLLALPDSSSREIYLFLDEAAHLHFTKLPELLSTGRSKGIKMCIGVQDLGLLTSRFSENEVNAMASMIGTLVVFRLSALGAAAEKTGSGLGKRVVERRDLNLNSANEASASWHQIEVPVVYPADIANLPQASKSGVVGYLSIAGTEIVAKLRWPLTTIKKQVAATELKSSALPTPLGEQSHSLPSTDKTQRLSMALSELDSVINKEGD